MSRGTTGTRRGGGRTLSPTPVVAQVLDGLATGATVWTRAQRAWSRALEGFVAGGADAAVTWPRALLAACPGTIPGPERGLAIHFAVQAAASQVVFGQLDRLTRLRGLAPGRASALHRAWFGDLPFPRLSGAHAPPPSADPLADVEVWQRGFHRTIPRRLRKTLGQFHSPEWLVERVLARLDEDRRRRGTLLDPGCGSGVFLRLLLRERLRQGNDAQAALDGLHGIEVDPLAVLLARFSLVLELARHGADWPSVRSLPIAWGDAVLGETYAPAREPRTVDALIGNPPWIGWDVLSRSYRERLRAAVLPRFHLYENEGFLSRLGGASDDLLHVFTSVTIDRWLRRGGAVLYLVKRTLFDNVTGRTFRRFRIERRDGTSRPLAVRGVEDLTPLGRIFDDGSGATALLALEADRETRWPVPWVSVQPHVSRTGCAAPARGEEGAPWRITWDDEERRAELCGANPYAGAIRHGLKHDAEEVFALRVFARDGDRVLCRDGAGTFEVEADLVYPYLKSRHVRPFGILGHAHVLLPQRRAGEDNEAWLREARPLAWAYLRRHAERLARRRSSVYRGGVFYALFGLGDYTFAPWRLAWCSMGEVPRFVVCGARADAFLGQRVPVLDSVHYAIAFEEPDEAHYLAALLNAAPVRTVLERRGGRSKRRFSKRVLAGLAIPRYDPEDERHAALVAFSRAAHARAAGEPFDADALAARAEACLRAERA